MTFDNFPVFIALVCAFASCVGYIYSGLRGQSQRALRAARALFYVSFGSIAYSTLYMLQLLVTAQRYDIAYIFNNSAPSDALIYRVSALWAGQQGSLLFWAFVCAVTGFVLLRQNDYKALLLSAFWLSVMTFLLMLLVVDDPFAPLQGFHRGMVGAGMNPLLKNPWMAIHPPIVFVGYALLMVPAAFVVQSLVTGSAHQWASRSLPWAAAGWAALTAGLALGMLWSYEVLGWGGYWGWDPVENASLVPWLTGGALLHGLAMQRSRRKLAHVNVLLALGTFLLILYATFLTRSGVLAEVSVHSFAQTPAHRLLLGTLVFYLILCGGLTAIGWRVVARSVRANKPDSADTQGRASDVLLGTGVAVLVLYALVVLAGTSYPIFADGVIQPQFYNRMSVPLALAICVLVALAPWTDGRRKLSASSSKWAGGGLVWFALGGAVVFGLIGGIYALVAPTQASRTFAWLISSEAKFTAVVVQMLLVLAFAAIIAAVSALLAAIRFRSRPLAAGAYVAHAGAALLALGVILSSAGPSVTLALSPGGPPAQAMGWSFLYRGIERTGPNSEAIRVDATKGGRRIPAALAIEYGERMVVRRPYLKSFALGDLYIAPTQIETETITPTASITEDGLVALPVEIPGAKKGSLTLLGMSVESSAARLQYVPQKGEPQTITVGADHPETVDGYTLVFHEFVTDDSQDMQHFTVGVTVGVTGNGLAEKAIVEVSWKPLVWLVWLGCALVFVGAVIAVVRRMREGEINK